MINLSKRAEKMTTFSGKIEKKLPSVFTEPRINLYLNE